MPKENGKQPTKRLLPSDLNLTIKFIVIMLPTIKRQNNWLPTIFNDFFNDDWFPMRAVAATAPAINVKETEKAFTVEIAVPGMSKDDFKVHVNDQDQLVVSVEKKQESKEEDKSTKYLRREFNYTRFEQALLLPEHVDKEAITAKACSGVLYIHLPKLTTSQEKRTTRVIEIQ
jgi:HSP20 family protein